MKDLRKELINFMKDGLKYSTRDASKMVDQYLSKKEISEYSKEYLESLRTKYVDKFVECNMYEGGGWLMYVSKIECDKDGEYKFYGPHFIRITIENYVTVKPAEGGYAYNYDGYQRFYEEYETNNYIEVYDSIDYIVDRMNEILEIELDMFDDAVTDYERRMKKI